ncbi:Endonuclease V [Desulfonema magnum]|uniref:Endonuclease V n=2 Tax=Desulfonema magnum TaxID=45655 RepID=A0A975GU34_9BACT|nr:Endonuclease V [Desulfonema magnum]
MILATDVDYRESNAVAAGILFERWESESPVKEITVRVSNVEAYVPGQFYKRELPCIKALLDTIHDSITCILIDGYVYLGKDRKPGLGKHLWDMLEGQIPVIGVAKSAFADTPEPAELIRGNSIRPLFVTSEGIDAEIARQCVRKMHGENRIPTLLRRVDALCRKGHGARGMGRGAWDWENMLKFFILLRPQCCQTYVYEYSKFQ